MRISDRSSDVCSSDLQAEQYQRIIDVVSRYAIHFGDRGVSVTCKKVRRRTNAGNPIVEGFTVLHLCACVWFGNGNCSMGKHLQTSIHLHSHRRLGIFEQSMGLPSRESCWS